MVLGKQLAIATYPMLPFGNKILGRGVFVQIELPICENLDLELVVQSREQDKRHNFMNKTYVSTKSLN